MMEFGYSKTTNAFYDMSRKDLFIEAGTWPGDVVEVEQNIADEFMQTPPSGKLRVSGDDGLPTWGDIPPPTYEQMEVVAGQQKTVLRGVADAEISWRQDAVDAGIATEEETAALSEWKKYRVLLMRVDTAKPVWPTPPGEQAS
ncbi:TPA: tail fiber assembly protein [Citrobacter freundii]|uniref:Tail fiber assembly protein n=1 Tax=Citrobacter freundii TaxID=546 RepID=A0AAN4EQK8_CITFR|nr:tail fiber assembly protein [Citrobacter freundii]HCE9103553.1 tail fiber assembly protein [Citrobacter freundii]